MPMLRTCPALVALALFACGSAAAQPVACRTLPRPWVRTVAPEHRAEALGLLQTTPVVALDEQRAATLIEVDAPPGGGLGERLLKDALNVMLDRKDTSIGEHALKWSASEQLALDGLVQASSQPHPPLQPVLVRALEGRDADGVFDAATCGETLAVRRREAAAGAPSPVPVIVFVERTPVAVQAWREGR